MPWVQRLMERATMEIFWYFRVLDEETLAVSEYAQRIVFSLAGNLLADDSARYHGPKHKPKVCRPETDGNRRFG